MECAQAILFATVLKTDTLVECLARFILNWQKWNARGCADYSMNQKGVCIIKLLFVYLKLQENSSTALQLI